MPFQHKRTSDPTLIKRPVDTHALHTLSSTPSVLRRIYAARGVESPEQLELGLAHLHPFSELKDIGEATKLLAAAVQQRSSILVVGDFDADGATSCALAVLALRALGARAVNYLVPNRFEYGYGLTPEIVELSRGFNPDLIITVDNGISSVEGVAAARALGCEVIITDHHLAGQQLPDAHAIVNPNQPGCGFPSKCIAGVGVMFYLLMSLRHYLRGISWFVNHKLPEPNLAQYLDLVALGTVADVVPLDRNNRIMVQQGLARIRSGRCRPGITALIEVAGRTPGDLVAADLGFAVAPRLNAAGRLQDMSFGIQCLLATTEIEAKPLSLELNWLNQERRAIESEMKDQALHRLESMDVEREQFGITLYDAEWHQGVVGIVASRIKEQYNRPVVAFANADSSGNELKGSARSIPGLHIRDALDAIATRNPGLLNKFGGHAMAAGLTLRAQHYEMFARTFDEQVAEMVAEEDLQARIYTDGALDEQDLHLELAEELRRAGPWGQAFPEPRFEGAFKVIDQRLVGEKHLKLRLATPAETLVFDAIAFFVDVEVWPQDTPYVRTVYKLDVNEFRGQRELQLIIDYLEPLSGLEVD